MVPQLIRMYSTEGGWGIWNHPPGENFQNDFPTKVSTKNCPHKIYYQKCPPKPFHRHFFYYKFPQKMTNSHSLLGLFFPFIWSKPSADRWALALKILKAFSRVCSGLQWTDFICSRAALSGCLSQPHSPRCTAPLCLFVLFLLLSLKRDKQTNKQTPPPSQPKQFFTSGSKQSAS